MLAAKARAHITALLNQRGLNATFKKSIERTLINSRSEEDWDWLVDQVEKETARLMLVHWLKHPQRYKDELEKAGVTVDAKEDD